MTVVKLILHRMQLSPYRDNGLNYTTYTSGIAMVYCIFPNLVLSSRVFGMLHRATHFYQQISESDVSQNMKKQQSGLTR